MPEKERFAENDHGGRVDDGRGDGGCGPSASHTGGEQRLCGPDGLLSVPEVKPLLFLVCVVQVCKTLLLLFVSESYYIYFSYPHAYNHDEAWTK